MENTNTTKQSKDGRPTKFDEKYCEICRKLALLGLTDAEMIDVLEIASSTFYLWKNEHPHFSEAINKGKHLADAEVAASLYERATGYSHKETDIKVIEGKIVKTEVTKHYPPDTAAGIIWLKNRDQKRWKDKQAQPGDLPPVIITTTVSPEEAKEILKSIQDKY